MAWQLIPPAIALGVWLGILTVVAACAPTPRRHAWRAWRQLHRAARTAPAGVALHQPDNDVAFYVRHTRHGARIYRYALDQTILPDGEHPGLILGEMYGLNLPPVVVRVPFSDYLRRDGADIQPAAHQPSPSRSMLYRALLQGHLRPTVADVNALATELTAAVHT